MIHEVIMIHDDEIMIHDEVIMIHGNVIMILGEVTMIHDEVMIHHKVMIHYEIMIHFKVMIHYEVMIHHKVMMHHKAMTFYRIMMKDMTYDMTHTTILTDSLLVSHVVPLLVVLTVGRVDKRQAAVSTLLAAGLGLVLQEMTVIRLGLPPPLGHELHVEHLKAVQT